MADQKAISDAIGSATSHSVLFILFVPSRTANGDQLPKGESQQMWANAAGQLMSELFSGATEMPAAKGKWFNPESKKVIAEDVILVHCYANSEDVENPDKIGNLAKFLHRMGKTLRQGEIGLVVDGVFHKINKFPLAGKGESK